MTEIVVISGVVDEIEHLCFSSLWSVDCMAEQSISG